MFKRLIVASALAYFSVSAMSQVSISVGIPAYGSPNVSIGLNLRLYPELIPVPGYPVYYAPQLNSNYFFYDAMYWVYQDDDWYASDWYNGPWQIVRPQYVPVFILRIPVRYYRQTPSYFRGWQRDAAPHWDQHWGNEWANNRRGWDNWDRKSSIARTPLPAYQRNYSGNRYPKIEQQRQLQEKNYRYQPKDPLVRQQVQAQRAAPERGGPPDRREAPDREDRGPQRNQEDAQRPDNRPQGQPERPPERQQAQQPARPDQRQQARPEARPEQQRQEARPAPRPEQRQEARPEPQRQQQPERGNERGNDRGPDRGGDDRGGDRK